MAAHHLIYVSLVVVSAVLAAAVATVGWRHRDIAGAVPLAGLMAAVTVWATAKLLELYTPGLSGTLFWANVQYLGIVIVPVAWLLFALAYTGRGQWLTPRIVVGLAVEPVVITGVLWTNGAHHLFRTSVGIASFDSVTTLTSALGPAFWVHAAYSYLLLGIGTVLIVEMVVVSDHLYRGQAWGLLAAVLFPWIGNGVFIVGLAPPGLDPTVIAFTLTGLILLGIIARHRLLDIVPAAREVARNALIESMTDAVVVVDDRNRLMDTNPAANDILGCEIPEAIGRPLGEVYPPLAAAIDSVATDDSEDFWTELKDRDADGVKFYDVRVSELQRGFGLLSGRLISLRDVTHQRQREQRLDVLNRLLRHNVRNELNVIGGNASLIRGASVEETADRVETIEQAVETMMERTEKVAQFANQSTVDSRVPIDIVDEVADLVAEKRQAHPDITVTMDGPDEAWVQTGPAVVTAIDELLVNAIKHAGVDGLTIAVTVSKANPDDSDQIQVSITDNGPGVPRHEIEPILQGRETPLVHSSGVGLWLVTWIVRESGGEIEFDESDDGTTVTVSLPRADTERDYGDTTHLVD